MSLRLCHHKRYVGNIFTLFWSPYHLTKHADIKFVNEKEVKVVVTIFYANIKGFTTVYYNSTFSGAYSSFNSFRVDKYKQAWYLHFLGILSIVSGFSKFVKK